jgi:small subunit ribosomal protein S10
MGRKIVKRNSFKKLRIILRAYSPEILVEACTRVHDLKETIRFRTRIYDSGSVPLPTRRRIYCVLRSPHVNKDSREHFEVRVHKRFLEVRYFGHDELKRVLNSLYYNLDLPSGVDIRFKLV